MPLRLAIPATVAALAPAQDRLAAYLQPLGLSPWDRYRIDLLFEEVLMNVVLHAFGDAASSHAVDVTVEAGDSEVRLQFEDDGPAFDPTTAEVHPPLRSLDDDRPAGGLGLQMLRRYSDSQTWQRVSGRNLLMLTVRRA